MKRWMAILAALTCWAQQPRAVRTRFSVRYVASGSVYIDGGREDGIEEGFRLTVKRLKPGEAELSAPRIGEIVVIAVASHSSACEIRSNTAELQVGDQAFLWAPDEEALRATQSVKTARQYAQVVRFSGGDPLEAEQREAVPKPPLPEVNRLRGRVSFEHSQIIDRDGSYGGSRQEGVVVRADMTRIGGSYWNLSGYWRGRANTRSGFRQQTISDLLNRTYHIGLYYTNPQSKYAAGFGRLLVPWANSVNTIDGGYIGRRIGRITTAGIFAGSTPDPTAWNYNPDRQIAGGFLNLSVGDFEAWRWSSTSGVALTRLGWRAERQYAFFENNLLYGRAMSLYHNLEADQLVRGRLGSNESGLAVSRSFLTLRTQPAPWLALDVNHNYFRSVPTFDERLLGFGLLDRLLFEGVSAGARLDLPHRVSVYTNLGRNRRSGDAKASLNQLYGVTLGRLGRTGIRADARYSRFQSVFVAGAYRALSLTREFQDKLRLELQAGTQDFRSEFSRQNRARWVNGSGDWLVGEHYVLGVGLLIYRGEIQNYDQIFLSLGYRF